MNKRITFLLPNTMFNSSTQWLCKIEIKELTVVAEGPDKLEATIKAIACFNTQLTIMGYKLEDTGLEIHDRDNESNREQYCN